MIKLWYFLQHKYKMYTYVYYVIQNLYLLYFNKQGQARILQSGKNSKQANKDFHVIVHNINLISTLENFCQWILMNKYPICFFSTRLANLLI